MRWVVSFTVQSKAADPSTLGSRFETMKANLGDAYVEASLAPISGEKDRYGGRVYVEAGSAEAACSAAEELVRNASAQAGLSDVDAVISNAHEWDSQKPDGS